MSNGQQVVGRNEGGNSVSNGQQVAGRNEGGNSVSNGQNTVSVDVKWMMLATVTIAIVAMAVGITAVTQVTHIAADMQHHEDRVTASNENVILQLQWLFGNMRDEYRERMHSIEDVLHELREVRRRLDARGETEGEAEAEAEAALRADIETALSNVERALNPRTHFHPVPPRDVERLLKEVRELRESLKLEATSGQ